MSSYPFYEVWDFESRNLLASYDTEDEALELVRSMIQEYGTEAVQQWGMARDSGDEYEAMATGEALINRALRRVRPDDAQKRAAG